MCRPGEIQEGASKLIIGHHYDVQPAMAVARPWQTADAHVFLLLSVLLVAHQVVCQKPFRNKPLCYWASPIESNLLSETILNLYKQVELTAVMEAL